MAIGPVSNAIYVNQQMASVASEKNALQNRFELQNLAAASAINDKEEEIQEVRPPEENQKVDADREHAKHEAEDEMQRNKKQHDEEEEPSEEAPVHHLDIKV